MRLKVVLGCRAGTSLPLNVSYHLASAIYRAIERADARLSLELHVPNRPKFFTFSKLFVPKKNFRIDGEKLIIEDEEVHFFFSSLRDELAAMLVEGLLRRPEMRIAGSDFSVLGIEVLEEKEIGREERFVTLSPVYATKAVNGKALDLYPTQKEFYEVLLRNLIRKYAIFYGKQPENPKLKFKIESFKPKRIQIKDTWHRCCEMTFEAEGNPELLELGYKAGFGGKNSMGFGMVKLA
ncbi:MAG: CRISPR-associated endoribonuclease Cas6 [Archaeoglobales archaeon]|nr:CRISPR-associated endoribonuclease Cas6 [Archaeoglobales archaeon]